MTIVSPAPAETPVRDLQKRAALVLADLLALDLPDASWTVCNVFGGELSGQINRQSFPDGPALTWTGLTLWAARLGVPVEQVERPGYVEASVTAVVDGVSVCVWGHIYPTTGSEA